MKINTTPHRSRQNRVWKVVPVVAALPMLNLVGMGDARAATQTQSYTFTPTSTDFTTGTSFNQFNSALGTLTEVDWIVSVNGNVNGMVTNNAPSAQDFTVDEKTTFKATGAGTAAITSAVLATTQDYTGLQSGASSAFGPFAPSNSATTAITGSGITGYVGNGTFNFGLKTVTGTSVTGGGGNVSANISTTAGATATVTYTYTPSAAAAAPEPGSLALLALPTLSAMGMVVRQRRRA